MASEQPVGGFGGGTRRTKDRAAVLAQHLQPRAEIIGVADGRGDAERGAEEGRTHFGDQFFAGIILAAETVGQVAAQALRSEEHTSELQSLMRISYAVFCLKKKITHNTRSSLMHKQHTN